MSAALIGRSIDSMVGSIDVDAIVSRIDVDKLARRIDWNKVLDSVDMDRQLSRVDVNAVLNRIDIDQLVERSNLEAIIARSSSGVFQQVLDLIRIRIVSFDMFAYRLGRCKCHEKNFFLPPTPGQKPSSHGGGGRGARPSLKPRTASTRTATRIVEVQGAYCGVVSKCLAWIFDEVIVLIVFAALAWGAESITQVIKGSKTFNIDPILLAVVYFGFGVMYRTVCLLLTRRTLGMIFMGLLLVDSNGRKPSVLRTIIRQTLELVLLSAIPVLGLFGLAVAACREDSRFPHELLTCTGVVYSWDVRMARLRLSGRIHDDDDDDDDDGGLWP